MLSFSRKGNVSGGSPPETFNNNLNKFLLNFRTGSYQGTACQDRRTDSGDRFFIQSARSLERARRKKLVDHNHDLSVVRQCKLLEVNCSSVYYCPKVLSRENEKLMRLIDKIYLEYPFKGSRRLRDVLLARHGICVNRKRVARLMRLLGLAALHLGPRTTHRGKGHNVYPYLLGGMAIECVNQVWAADVTLYSYVQGVCAVMDWHSRKVLSWRVSNIWTTISA